MNRNILTIAFSIISFSTLAQKENDSCLIYVPNNLTMNCRTGEDYQLKVKSSCALEEYSIEIFNRWGEILFTSNDINETWDAEDYQGGVYFWRIKAVFENGEHFEKSSTVQLLK